MSASPTKPIGVLLTPQILHMLAKVYVPVLFPLTFLIVLAGFAVDRWLGLPPVLLASPLNWVVGGALFLARPRWRALPVFVPVGCQNKTDAIRPRSSGSWASPPPSLRSMSRPGAARGPRPASDPALRASPERSSPSRVSTRRHSTPWSSLTGLPDQAASR